MLDVQAALKELKEKTYGQIQYETSFKWASRAAASYQNCLSVPVEEKLVCWTIAEEFYHEAVEHAALVSNNDTLLKQIRDLVHPFQEKAAQSMGVNPEKIDLV